MMALTLAQWRWNASYKFHETANAHRERWLEGDREISRRPEVGKVHFALKTGAIVRIHPGGTGAGTGLS